MATIEKDILVNKKNNGNIEIFYPITKGGNVLCEDGETVEEKFGAIGTDNLNQATITTTTEISENTNYTIPLKYKVGNNSLSIFYMGEKLIKGVHYIEVGTTGTVSQTIQFYNWDQSVPTGRTIEFIVRGDYE